jgi:ribosome recycling factor
MINDIMTDARGRMGSAVDSFKKDIVTVRTGRASISMLDDVRVEMYGTMMPLNQLSTVSTPDARLIVVQPWDRASIEPIERAINAANLGLSPSNDGKVIRLPVPPLSEERRRDLVKQVKKRNEEAKVAIRGVRRDAKEMIEELEKESEVGKDEAHRALEELQGVTDSFSTKVDELTAVKEKEIMEF